MIADQYLASGLTVAATTTTNAFDLVDLTTFCVEVTFSGVDVAGTLTLQGSLSGTTGTFFAISGSSTAITASGGHTYDVVQSGYRFVRVNLATATGTGAMTVKLTAKQTVVKTG